MFFCLVNEADWLPQWQGFIGPLAVVYPFCGQQPGQSGEGVGGHRQDEARPQPLNATIAELAQPKAFSSRFRGLIDREALTGRVVRPIDGGLPRFLRGMQACRGSATKSALSYPLSAPSVSRNRRRSLSHVRAELVQRPVKMSSARRIRRRGGRTDQEARHQASSM